MKYPIKLDEEMKARVQNLAELHNCSLELVLLEAVREYVEREESKLGLTQETLQRLKEYKQTGLHVTFEEADAWLEKLESGQELEPPDCHV